MNTQNNSVKSRVLQPSRLAMLCVITLPFLILYGFRIIGAGTGEIAQSALASQTSAASVSRIAATPISETPNSETQAPTIKIRSIKWESAGQTGELVKDSPIEVVKKQSGNKKLTGSKSTFATNRKLKKLETTSAARQSITTDTGTQKSKAPGRSLFPQELYRTASELQAETSQPNSTRLMAPQAWLTRQTTEYRFEPLTDDWLHAKPIGRPGTRMPQVERFGVLSLVKPFPERKTYTVLLDAGHGGSDPGTVGPAGLREKDLTLDISNRVKKLLQRHPHISVALSRQSDVGFSRERRLRSAKTLDADLLISLHFNNLPQKDLTIVESFYAGPHNILESELGRLAQAHLANRAQPESRKVAYNPRHDQRRDLSFTQYSKSIAEILQRNIYQEVQRNNAQAVNAGVKTDTLYMLTQSYIPGTLIELTCLSDKEEEKRLQTSQYRKKIASAIADGIIEYFTSLPDLEARVTGI